MSWPIQSLKAVCTPRVVGALTVQATLGRRVLKEAPARDQEPPSATFLFLLILRLLCSPQQPQQQRTGSAVAIDGASSCLVTQVPPR